MQTVTLSNQSLILWNVLGQEKLTLIMTFFLMFPMIYMGFGIYRVEGTGHI